MNIGILLCTYNGEEYLLDQLNSYLAQSYKNWHLYISDDNSTDSTLNIINSWIVNNNLNDKVTIFTGPGCGYAKNFMSLTANMQVKADLYFWSDQDDVWLPEKLEQICKQFEQFQHIPVLYCGRSILVDDNNNKIGLSNLHNKFSPSFNNALVQCIGGGNTMAFNNLARNLIVIGSDYDILDHDWWSYLIVSGHGGKIIYDINPFIRYRQHANNISGRNNSFIALKKRFIELFFRKTYKEKINLYISTLSANKNKLTEENYLTLSRFMELRASRSFLKKLLLFHRLRIRRQSCPHTMVFNIAFALNLI
jgi:glycosyltransferase involved in cell wall biosynthesis